MLEGSGIAAGMGVFQVAEVSTKPLMVDDWSAVRRDWEASSAVAKVVDAKRTVSVELAANVRMLLIMIFGC